jgi:formate dehydrogenase subunit gamma
MTLHALTGKARPVGLTDAQLAERVDAIVAAHAHLEGPLLPILHAVQHDVGHVPEEALRRIAKRLNISRAEAHGVMTFYHDFRAAPAGRAVIKLCRAEACQSVGSERLAAHAEAALGVKSGETTADGAVTLEAVYCLGLCACGPAALVDGKVVGRLTEARLDALLAERRA